VLYEDLCFDAQQAAEKAIKAVESRYPGVSEEVTEEDYVEALALAERAVQWAESLIPRSLV
jgi:HEPN domain-containing protein